MARAAVAGTVAADVVVAGALRARASVQCAAVFQAPVRRFSAAYECVTGKPVAGCRVRNASAASSSTLPATVLCSSVPYASEALEDVVAASAAGTSAAQAFVDVISVALCSYACASVAHSTSVGTVEEWCAWRRI